MPHELFHRTQARTRPAYAGLTPGPRLDGKGTRARNQEGDEMATYRMVYGDSSQVVRETYDNVDEVQREDGWLVLFRGSEAILRVQEAHVQSFEELVD